MSKRQLLATSDRESNRATRKSVAAAPAGYAGTPSAALPLDKLSPGGRGFSATRSPVPDPKSPVRRSSAKVWDNRMHSTGGRVVVKPATQALERPGAPMSATDRSSALAGGLETRRDQLGAERYLQRQREARRGRDRSGRPHPSGREDDRAVTQRSSSFVSRVARLLRRP